MSITHGKLVPKRLAGWSTGRRTMQDDDSLGGSPHPPPDDSIVDESDVLMVDENGVQLVTE